MAGVESVLLWAVPNVSAMLPVGPSVRGNRFVELRQEAAGGGRQWLGGGGGGGRLGGGGGRGGAGGVFQELFFGPCGHAATSSSSPLIGGAPDPVHRQWLDIPVMLQ